MCTASMLLLESSHDYYNVEFCFPTQDSSMSKFAIALYHVYLIFGILILLTYPCNEHNYCIRLSTFSIITIKVICHFASRYTDSLKQNDPFIIKLKASKQLGKQIIVLIVVLI